MHMIKRKRVVWGAGLALVMALMFILSAPNASPATAQTPPPEDGLICTTSPNATFTLTAQTGYIGTPDDNVLFMWGFSEGSSPFQYPGPILCVTEGDTVTVILHNTLNEDVSIVFPGQEDVMADGAPAQPQFDGGGAMTSMTNVAPANGGSVTYSFVATSPGTFVYESGTDPAKQVRMGLFGALIVRPALGPNFANNRSDSEFNPDAEFLVMFSEIDPFLSQAVERGRPFNMNNYKPRYWMLNGRGFPDTIAPNFASWLPSQPYGALARIYPYDPVANPKWALERFINMGSEIIPMHPHSKNALIINRDGRPVEGLNGEDMAWENYSVPVGPGQSFDGLFRWEEPEDYTPDNPVPVTIPNIQNMVYGPMYSGSPYLGVPGDVPVGTTSLNQCGEFYIISHNHALYQITSWGAPTTGPITYMRIDPPLPNNCP